MCDIKESMSSTNHTNFSHVSKSWRAEGMDTWNIIIIKHVTKWYSTDFQTYTCLKSSFVWSFHGLIFKSESEEKKPSCTYHGMTWHLMLLFICLIYNFSIPTSFTVRWIHLLYIVKEDFLNSCHFLSFYFIGRYTQQVTYMIKNHNYASSQ